MVQRSAKFRSSSREKYSIAWKVLLIAGLVLFSLWELYPSIKYYSMSATERTAMDPGDLDNLKRKALNLGLDLQGGIHLVMQVDTSGMKATAANDAVDRAMSVIANRVIQFGLTEPLVQRELSLIHI